MANREQLIGQLIGASCAVSREQAWRKTEIGALEKVKLDLGRQVLIHPEFRALIDQGYITFGAIKPHAEQSGLQEASSDTIAALKALRLITQPLQLIFHLSVNLNEKDIGTIYEEVKTRIPETEWKQFSDYMQSGPVTYFILYDKTGDAVANWRRQMGATDPEKAEQGTIRARYGLSRMANLTHGAASVEDVKREINWFAKKIETLL